MSAANGGQVLLSQAAVDLVRDRLPELISLRELGLVRLETSRAPSACTSCSILPCATSSLHCVRWNSRRTTCRSRQPRSSAASANSTK